eukprot:CAMPEP_0195136564 /NCGR_PEP_ID=MMETSP0448-20130528/154468_1 /TAXON_ID=66468 /ORGANISM="Heterocapsa triquestra, Strain CCMP 448" /LENGTH=48 /DNA_ID= /DNA_START= /DNA_END= /DNA_ORIENTATION=
MEWIKAQRQVKTADSMTTYDRSGTCSESEPSSPKSDVITAWSDATSSA